MMRQPKLLIIVGVLSVLVMFGFIWMGTDSSDKHASNSPNAETHQTFDVASGDTNNEVLKSIIARQKALQKKNTQLQELNKKLQQEHNLQAHKDLQKIQQLLIDKIKDTKQELAAQFKKQLQAIKQKPNSKQNTQYPINTALEKSSKAANATIINTVTDLSAKFVQQQRLENTEVPTLPSDRNNNKKTSIPYYTIPDGATAANARLLSPLIGEVPVNGQLLSPAFPFKAMLSYKDTEDMFAANSIPLPHGISGTVLQGYAVGNMSLACTRAYVMKVLFVFHDGHYVVFPDKQTKSNATQVYPKDAIGYLSDSYNNPCITGKYITDAPRVIASLTAFGVSSGIGGAIAQSQTRTIGNIANGTGGTIFSGNLGKYALGSGIGKGSKAALDWYKSRVSNIFDAIFVSSTKDHKPRQLIFNITKTIAIDLKKNGRTLSYANSSKMSATDTSFS